MPPPGLRGDRQRGRGQPARAEARWRARAPCRRRADRGGDAVASPAVVGAGEGVAVTPSTAPFGAGVAAALPCRNDGPRVRGRRRRGRRRRRRRVAVQSRAGLVSSGRCRRSAGSAARIERGRDLGGGEGVGSGVAGEGEAAVTVLGGDELGEGRVAARRPGEVRPGSGRRRSGTGGRVRWNPDRCRSRPGRGSRRHRPAGCAATQVRCDPGCAFRRRPAP